ncbi:MAG: hypothetical protein KQI62_15125 [Deltaproteobacteria bacterium]|nr:hypothetical protein [Deltaproteobacteria bacterium]
MKTRTIPLLLLSLLLCAVPAWAGSDSLAQLCRRAVSLTSQRLGPLEQASSVACITNAGYAAYGQQGTLPLLDELPRLTAISPGRGNLLVRPGAPWEPLYFLFLKKEGPDKLMAIYLQLKEGKLTAGPALNLHLGDGTPLKPFKKVLGPMTFNLVTLANGWAMGLPPDLMRAALKHGHLCCGVFTGYFTARYILKHMPLTPGQGYIYIGAPAWCQDDYITDYLRLTPGTHGYLTMAYPWWRPWTTDKRAYKNLGGVVIRWDNQRKTGRAWVLSFDWHNDEFRKYLGKPDLKLDWKGQPWLHMAYDRFFMSRLGQTEHFVSMLKSEPLKGQAQLDRLTRLGANPLGILLGPDPSWPDKPKQ